MASPVQAPELELDLGRYVLVRAGRSVRLEKQPMELLILLVQKRGQLVTRDEIVARLWGEGVFLDTERSINTAIRKIRLALHDHPDRPQVIETVVGKGYRFIAPITVVTPEAERAPGQPPSRGTAPRHAILVFWPLIAILLITASLSVLLGRKWLQARTGPPPIQSIAVLPLQNVSGDPQQEYFAAGMTDTLITDIAKISGLRVISHTSVLHYRNTSKTLPEIGRELKVDAVVEGSVARGNGRVRITAQLIEAATDRHLWADTYERSTADLLALQDDVARDIARHVQSKLSAQAQKPPLHPRDAGAQDAYFKGVQETDTYSREGLNRAVDDFQAAVERDPQFARAWAGLSHAYSLIALFHYAPGSSTNAKADAAALKSIQLDENLSEAHLALSGSFIRRKAWSDAEKELRRAVQLNPSDSVAHQNLGYLLAGVLGRPDEGVQEMARALDLDPLSPSKKNSIGAAYYWARRDDDALRVFRDLPDGDANTERRHRRMAEIYDRKGLQPQAVEEWVHAAQATGRQELVAAVQRAYRSSGYAAARKAFLLGDLRDRELRARRGDDSASMWIAADYAILGNNDQAFAWLNKAFAEGEHALMYLKVERHFDNLRNDSRYPELLRRLGLN